MAVVALFVLLVAAVSASNEIRLKHVVVKIDYAGENFFIDEDQIEIGEMSS